MDMTMEDGCMYYDIAIVGHSQKTVAKDVAAYDGPRLDEELVYYVETVLNLVQRHHLHHYHHLSHLLHLHFGLTILQMLKRYLH